MVAPEEQSEEDQASDFYRDIETHDIVMTIRSNPVMGIGFGQQFYRPWPLPNISFFVFWEYITHNSILWIWMKAGIGGFVACSWLFATALRSGARALLRRRTAPDPALTVASAGYVLMFAMFAYVDIAWDTRNVVLLAVCPGPDRSHGDRRVRRRRARPSAAASRPGWNWRHRRGARVDGVLTLHAAGPSVPRVRPGRAAGRIVAMAIVHGGGTVRLGRLDASSAANTSAGTVGRPVGGELPSPSTSGPRPVRSAR